MRVVLSLGFLGAGGGLRVELGDALLDAAICAGSGLGFLTGLVFLLGDGFFFLEDVMYFDANFTLSAFFFVRVATITASSIAPSDSSTPTNPSDKSSSILCK